MINGLWLHAFGTELNADAEFKAEIITLNAKGEMDKVLATATLSASQVGKEQAGKDSYFYVLDFKFDDNVVVTPDMCQAFVARVSGFHGSRKNFSSKARPGHPLRPWLIVSKMRNVPDSP